ncbi:MAG: oligosaccharide flippase family protein [Desulfobacterales bacterium]|nr:oligosaccharide flippase family protein [Desulfobacterales bacterium]
MSLRTAVLKGARVLVIGQATAQGLVLIRHMIVAQNISTADVGIGIALMSCLTLVEMMSSVRPDALLIQADDGDDPELQASVQTLESLRGLISGTVLFLLASPLAFWFEKPEAAWAFQTIAILPLLRGVGHLDPKRVQRQLNYTTDLWVAVVPQLLTALVAWPVARWLGDYSAVLLLMFVRAIAATITTHIVATRKYRWSLNREHFRRIVSFGWPLLLTGGLIYLVTQGDRFIIGSRYTHYSIAALGLFGLARNTTAASRELVAATANPILLPLFSQTRNDPARLEALYTRSCQGLAVVAAGSCIPFFLMGGRLMGWIYGEEYHDSANFIGWLAAAQAMNMLCNPPIRASLAMADTRNSLITSLVRGTSLMAMILVAVLEGSLAWMAIAGLAGEAAGFVASSLRLHKTSGIKPGLSLRPACFTLAWIFVGWALSTQVYDTSSATVIVTCLSSLLAVVITGLLCFPLLRHEASATFARFS